MNKEEQREKLNEVWDSIGRDSVDYLDANFKNIAPRLLEFLIISILNEDTIEIAVTTKGSKAIFSEITFDIYNTDKRLTLKLHPKSVFELELYFYDWEDEKQTYTHKLSKEETKIIPEGLITSMLEALKKEDTISINTKHLKS